MFLCAFPAPLIRPRLSSGVLFIPSPNEDADKWGARPHQVCRWKEQHVICVAKEKKNDYKHTAAFLPVTGRESHGTTRESGLWGLIITNSRWFALGRIDWGNWGRSCNSALSKNVWRFKKNRGRSTASNTLPETPRSWTSI